MSQQSQTIISLFSTSGCHLCELAEQLLIRSYPNQRYHVIEIAEDELLVERYGERIPVLRRSDNASELNWPFTTADIQLFMDA